MSAAVPEVVLQDDPCPMGCPPQDVCVLQAGDRLHGLPGRFEVRRCRHCGLMRTNPRPTPGTIGFYYPPDYAPYHVPREAPPRATRWHRLKRRCCEAMGLYEPHRLPVEPPGHLLEVGCANGSYLVEARGRGWQVEGIEFSAQAAAQARHAGFGVRVGSVDALPAPAQPPQLLVGWMVFEHVHDPVKTFATLASWVAPGGWIALSTPDAGALEFRVFRQRWYALQLPTHMTHFTPRTLRQVLARSGWQVRKVFWHQNPNNLLHSIGYWADDHGFARLSRLMRDMAAGTRLFWANRLLGAVLALTRQSGRMTVWAQRVPL